MSVPADQLGEALQAGGITFFTGVPDSLMKPLCAWVLALDADRHAMQANEGTAVALAAGHALDGRGVAAVYLQNSGIGNAVNPLLSLAAPEVYGLPMVLLIGWRGAPGHRDEPQHQLQGRVLCAMLDAMEVPRYTLPDDPAEALDLARRLPGEARRARRPVALLVPPEGIGPAVTTVPKPTLSLAGAPLRREEAIEAIVARAGQEAWVVATTGKTARELYAVRKTRGEEGQRDLLVVGSMGHASTIALGHHAAAPDRVVWCLDGDGAALMHLGAMPVLAAQAPARFVHVLFNNGVHESVGGQPLPVGPDLWAGLAAASGYVRVLRADTATDLQDALDTLPDPTGPVFLEVRVAPGSRPDLPRPSETPQDRLAALRDAQEPA